MMLLVTNTNSCWALEKISTKNCLLCTIDCKLFRLQDIKDRLELKDRNIKSIKDIIDIIVMENIKNINTKELEAGLMRMMMDIYAQNQDKGG